MDSHGFPDSPPAASLGGRASDWEEINYGLLDPKLEGLVRAALEFLPAGPSAVAPRPDHGLFHALQGRIDRETDPLLQQRIVNLRNDLKTYFLSPSHDPVSSNDGQVLLTVSTDCLDVYLTVTPPRGRSAAMPTINRVRHALDRAQIVHGIDFERINQSLEIVREQINDMVWRAPIARGDPPSPAKSRYLAFAVRVIDKVVLRSGAVPLDRCFEPPWEPVTEGTVLGHVVPSQEGLPGRNVYGEPLPPQRPAPVDFELGDEIHSSRGVLTAQTGGYVTVDGMAVNIVPLYILDNPEPGSLHDFSFPGAVLVRGDLRGPGSVECEDLYVLGHCETMNVNARGDVFIGGGIVGHNQSVIEADGGVHAAFVSEARLSALAEVVVANAIINSHVTSNKHVVVTSEKGMIAGGTIQALREIVVRTIGSEFGMMTETVVGKDFLTTARLDQIIERIREHEAGLRRIQELKGELSKARVRVEDLPSDKQELFLGVLRKESQSQAELRSLARRRARLSSQLREFLSASVRVLDSIYPPTRVQIVNEIKDIRNKLNSVTLKYDADIKSIVTTSIEGHGKEPS